jgi:RHS repeat-associated protein
VILRPAGCHEPGGCAILPRRRPSFAPLRTSLGTTSVVLNDDGTVHSEARHYPYGEERWRSGTLPTDYRFTGQRSDGYTKLTVMGTRWYDGQIGRWISPDPIIPDPANPQSFNRLSCVYNNPLRYRDPTGHFTEEQIMQLYSAETWDEVLAIFEEGGELAGQWGWLGVLRAAEFGDKVDFLAEKQNSVSLYFRFAERVFEECDGGVCSIANAMVQQATAFDLWRYVPGRWSPGPGPGGQVPAPYRRSVLYHADAKYPVSRINWDKADRTGAVVDIVGIGGDIAFLFPLYGTAIWGGSEMVELWDWGRKWHKFEAGDPWDVVNEIVVQGLQAAKFLPEGGWVGNVLSLTGNLLQGWEYTP